MTILEDNGSQILLLVSFSPGLNQVPVIIYALDRFCLLEVNQSFSELEPSSVNYAWVMDDWASRLIWSIPSGDDSHWKEWLCQMNYVQGALTKDLRLGLGEWDDFILTIQSRKFSGVQRLFRSCLERLVCPIVTSLSLAIWEFTYEEIKLISLE